MVLDLASALDRTTFKTRLFIHKRWGQHLQSVEPDLDVHFQQTRPYRRADLLPSLVANCREATDAYVVVGAIEGRATMTALLASLVRRRPIVLWMHCDWSRFVRHVSWRQLLALRLYRFANRVVCCSAGAEKAFRALVPTAGSKLAIIYNGIHVDEVQRLSREPIEEAHDPIFAKPVIVAAGRLDVQKGFDILINAHARMRRAVDCNLVILGEGPEGDSLQRCAAENGVGIPFSFSAFKRIRSVTCAAQASLQCHHASKGLRSCLSRRWRADRRWFHRLSIRACRGAWRRQLRNPRAARGSGSSRSRADGSAR